MALWYLGPQIKVLSLFGGLLLLLVFNLVFIRFLLGWVFIYSFSDFRRINKSIDRSNFRQPFKLSWLFLPYHFFNNYFFNSIIFRWWIFTKTINHLDLCGLSIIFCTPQKIVRSSSDPLWKINEKHSRKIAKSRKILRKILKRKFRWKLRFELHLILIYIIWTKKQNIVSSWAKSIKYFKSIFLHASTQHK